MLKNLFYNAFFFLEVSTPSVEYRSVGCFADKRHRAIPTLEGADPISAEKYDERTRAIEKCALAARKRGFTMFAVQYNGQCMSSATAEQTFNRYGESKECNANGKGGSWANNVYIIRGLLMHVMKPYSILKWESVM